MLLFADGSGQSAVVGRPIQYFVHLHFGDNILVELILTHGPLQTVRPRPHIFQQVRGEVANRQRAHQIFQDQPYFGRLPQFLEVDGSDDGAHPGKAAEQAVVLQAEEDLPQRRLAQVVGLYEFLIVDCGAGRQFLGDDPELDGPVNFILEHILILWREANRPRFPFRRE